MSEPMIQVDIKGIVPAPAGHCVFVGTDEKVIAIFVDFFVASAIERFIKGETKPRPLTHDLIANIFAGFGITAQKVVINDLKDETFYARLYLSQANELGKSFVEIDARPSDSMAIAVQQNCPIFVARHVWEQSENMRATFEQIYGSGGAPPSDESGGDVDEDDDSDTFDA